MFFWFLLSTFRLRFSLAVSACGGLKTIETIETIFFTRLLVNSSTYLLVYSSTCQLVNLSTCQLVYNQKTALMAFLQR